MLFVPDISLWQWLTDLVIVVALLDAECRATIKPLPDLRMNTLNLYSTFPCPTMLMMFGNPSGVTIKLLSYLELLICNIAAPKRRALLIFYGRDVPAARNPL